MRRSHWAAAWLRGSKWCSSLVRLPESRLAGVMAQYDARARLLRFSCIFYICLDGGVCEMYIYVCIIDPRSGFWIAYKYMYYDDKT